MGGTLDDAVAMLPHRWQRVDVPVAELVIELENGGRRWSAPPCVSRDATR